MEFMIERKKGRATKDFENQQGYSICKHWYYRIIERNSDDDVIACSDDMYKFPRYPIWQGNH